MRKALLLLLLVPVWLLGLRQGRPGRPGGLDPHHLGRLPTASRLTAPRPDHRDRSQGQRLPGQPGHPDPPLDHARQPCRPSGRPTTTASSSAALSGNGDVGHGDRQGQRRRRRGGDDRGPDRDLRRFGDAAGVARPASSRTAVRSTCWHWSATIRAAAPRRAGELHDPGRDRSTSGGDFVRYQLRRPGGGHPRRRAQRRPGDAGASFDGRRRGSQAPTARCITRTRTITIQRGPDAGSAGSHADPDSHSVGGAVVGALAVIGAPASSARTARRASRHGARRARARALPGARRGAAAARRARGGAGGARGRPRGRPGQVAATVAQGALPDRARAPARRLGRARAAPGSRSHATWWRRSSRSRSACAWAIVERARPSLDRYAPLGRRGPRSGPPQGATAELEATGASHPPPASRPRRRRGTDRRGRDEAEDGELVTVTLGNLYLLQGHRAEAERIFRRILRSRSRQRRGASGAGARRRQRCLVPHRATRRRATADRAEERLTSGPRSDCGEPTRI